MRLHTPITIALATGTLAFAVLGGSASAASDGPTCSNLGIVVHGQHIVGDYVTGLGALLPGTGDLQWPPAGQVGTAVKDNGGALIPGGPGPGFHFGEGLPPGASFCLEQAHPNGFTPPANVPTPGNR